MTGCNRDYLGIVFYFFHKKQMLSPLEQSQKDCSNVGLQHMFSLRNKKNHPKIIPVTPCYLELHLY